MKAQTWMGGLVVVGIGINLIETSSLPTPRTPKHATAENQTFMHHVPIINHAKDKASCVDLITQNHDPVPTEGYRDDVANSTGIPGPCFPCQPRKSS